MDDYCIVDHDELIHLLKSITPEEYTDIQCRSPFTSSYIQLAAFPHIDGVRFRNQVLTKNPRGEPIDVVYNFRGPELTCVDIKTGITNIVPITDTLCIPIRIMPYLYIEPDERVTYDAIVLRHIYI